MTGRRCRGRWGPAVSAALALTLVTAAGCTSTRRASDAGTSATTSARSSGAPQSSSAAVMAQAVAGSPAVLVSDLRVPWGLAFLPDSTALVTERDSHRLLHVTSTGAVTELGIVPGVAPNAGEGGLLGIAVSPSFSQDRYVYLYLTSSSDNRVVRHRLDDLSSLGQSGYEPVITGIPKGPNHNGGRIAFGPDGNLYVTTGDGGQRGRAQDLSSLGGKVLRARPDGTPVPGSQHGLIFTWGHRNPQGLAWTPDGRLYEAEFGQDTSDEINLLEEGHDYGWPAVEGTTGSRDPKYTPPLLTFATDDASPSALAYDGGSLWLAALKGARLYRSAVRTDGSLTAPTELFQGRYGRLRTVLAAPDGSLWIMTSNQDGRGDPTGGDDRIIRLPLS